MANQHGGARTPSSPAAVSGPGALSARTDGGPAKTLVPPAASHGDRAAIEAQLGASPPAGSPGTVAGGPAPTPVTESLPGMALPDPFAPTDRPGEDPRSLPSQRPALNDNAVLSILYTVHPSPYLAALLRQD